MNDEPTDKLLKFVRDLQADPLAAKSELLEKFQDHWCEVAGYVSQMATDGSPDARKVLDLMYELRPSTRIYVEWQPPENTLGPRLGPYEPDPYAYEARQAKKVRE